MNEKPIHLTIVYPCTPQMKMLEVSSRLMGFEFVGLPKVWRSERLKKIDKFTLLKNYLCSGALSPDDIILFTDAYDVLILQSADSIIQKLLFTGSDLIFNAETTFFPTANRKPEVQSYFDSVRSPWRYLNSGCFIGFSWAIERLVDYGLSIAMVDPSADDQALAQDFFVAQIDRGEVKVSLDANLKIFATINATAHEFYVCGRGVYHPSRLDEPVSVIHSNGDKSNIAILEELLELVLQKETGQLMIKVIKYSGQYVKLKGDAKKFTTDDIFDETTVFVAIVGNRKAIAFTGATDCCITFGPHGTLDCSCLEPGSWEVLSASPNFRSSHNLDITAYAAENSAVFYAENLSLTHVKAPFFRIARKNANFFTRFLTEKPWLSK